MKDSTLAIICGIVGLSIIVGSIIWLEYNSEGYCVSCQISEHKEAVECFEAMNEEEANEFGAKICERYKTCVQANWSVRKVEEKME